MEGFGQVAVNVFDGQLIDVPWQSLGQHPELLGVSGAGPDLYGVVKGKLVDGHLRNLHWGREFSPNWGLVSTRPSNRYNPHMTPRTPSSIVYGTLRSALVRYVVGDHPILRLAFFAALTAFLWLNRLGLVCTLLVLGHLGEAIKELCPKEGD